MDKVERDGKVAVLYSPGFGAGWSTWNRCMGDVQWLMFAPELVEAVLAGNRELAAELAKAKIPGLYDGGKRDLEVYWVPKGEAFRIHEYDGSEDVVMLADDDIFIA